MALFKSTPNLPDGEKARIEFHFHQLAESIGFERFRLPVLEEQQLLQGSGTGRAESGSVDQVKSLIGTHLGHDVNNVNVQTLPMQTQKVGGGG